MSDSKTSISARSVDYARGKDHIPRDLLESHDATYNNQQSCIARVSYLVSEIPTESPRPRIRLILHENISANTFFYFS
jgi:hypothetical protein